jgi:glycine/D-amino acid oxidase-like deaminating enzyme
VSFDAAIIGGGIIGCSAAAMMAERGARVALYEATAIGAGASGRNLGVLQHPFDPELAPLYHDSLDRYARLAADDHDFDLAAEPAGLLLLTPDPEEARAQADRLRAAVPELRPEAMDPDAVAAAEPSLALGLAACRLHTGHPVPPAAATRAWARLAERHGVTFNLGSGARPWIEGGRVLGVRLADGGTVAAGQVLVAAGPWSPAVADPTGAWQPILRTWGVTVQLSLGTAAPRHVIEQDEVDAVNRPAAAAARVAETGNEAEPPSLFSLASAGGTSTLGSTFLPAEPDAAHMAELLISRGSTYLPAIASAPVVEVRRCARPQSVDGRPFIGALPWADGLFICAGHGPWGISTGPASAALAVAAMLQNWDPPPTLAAGRDLPPG